SRPPGALNHPIPPRDLPGDALLARAVLTDAQILDQLARVDRHRAGVHAGPIRGARLDRVVLILLEQRVEHGRAGLLARHLAAQPDPLARGRGDVARWAHRFAEPALDALGRDLLDFGRRFEI